MQSAETLANLQKVLTLLNSSLHLGEMLTDVARQLVEMFEVDHSGVLFFGEADPEGEVIAEYPAQGAVGLRVPLIDYPLVEQLKRERRPIAIQDAQNDPLMGPARPTMRTLGINSIVIIPLVVQDKIVGSLSLDSIRQERTFYPYELELCHIIGNQIAVAVDYTRALETAEANRRQAQTLREVSRVLSQSLNLEEILPLILDELQKVVPADGSSIFLLVDGGLRLGAARGPYGPYQGRGTVPVEELWGARTIIEQKTPMLISDTHQHERWVVYEGSPVRSWLGLPLSSKGEILGNLNLDGYVAHMFNETHVPIAQAFADQAAIAIHNARLYGQAQQRAEQLASVHEIGLSLTASLELEEVLRTVANSVLVLLEASYLHLFLYNQPDDAFTLASGLKKGGEIELTTSSPRKDGLTARVARSGEPIVVPDTVEHPLFQDYDEYEGFRAIIGLPLKKANEVLGVLNVFFEQPHQFTSAELDLLNLLATQAAVALDNARLYELQVRQVEQELSIARQIQRGFFPQRIPSLPGWDISAICQPARETGGDFFEFARRADGLLGLIIGDVSGKSITAAMLMAAAQSVVQAKGSDHRSPAKVLAETNRLLHEDVPEGAFVAMSYALLEPDDGTVYLSNGGQLDPYLVPASGQPVRLIETPGNRLPLGVLPEIDYQETSILLEPGDLLVFYTDGLVEQHDGTGKMFGFERVAAELDKLRGQPAQVTLSTLLHTAGQFAGDVGPHDDVTLIVLQRKG